MFAMSMATLAQTIRAWSEGTAEPVWGPTILRGFFYGFVVVGILLFAFWLWMLIDCLTHEFPGNDKLIWVLVIILLGPLGALIYRVVGCSRSTKA